MLNSVKRTQITSYCKRTERSISGTGMLFFFVLLKEVCMKGKKEPACTGRRKMLSRFARQVPGVLCFCAAMSIVYACPVFAATNIWTKAKEIMQDVYNQILLISTITAIVTASVALLMMNFSRSGRTVDESRAWLKRICITWVILNSLGFIMAYITPFFEGGQWNG